MTAATIGRSQLLHGPPKAGLRAASRTVPHYSGALGEPQPTASCNIGPAELRRRRRAALMAALALGSALLALFLGVLPPWTAPWLAPLVGLAVATALQVWLQFCVAFGLAGVAGMGEHPGTETVDPVLRTAHRRRAALMLAVTAVSMLGWVALTGAVVPSV